MQDLLAYPLSLVKAIAIKIEYALDMTIREGARAQDLVRFNQLHRELMELAFTPVPAAPEVPTVKVKKAKVVVKKLPVKAKKK